MSEVEAPAEETKKETLSGSLSANVLNALAPMIRETQDYSHSMEFFCNQMSESRCTTYLIPADPGVVVCVVDPHRMLAAHDPSGYASRVMRVYFPDGLLDAVKPKTVSLCDENGVAFEAECEPKPERVMLFDGFGSVFPSGEAVNKWEGSFGTWFNGDHGNMRDGASYRAEAGDVSFIPQTLSADLGPEAASADINLALLTPFCHASDVLGLPVRVSMRGEVVCFYSTDGGTLFGMVAPLKFKDDFDAAGHLIAKTLRGSAL